MFFVPFHCKVSREPHWIQRLGGLWAAHVACGEEKNITIELAEEIDPKDMVISRDFYLQKDIALYHFNADFEKSKR